jgi:mandelate racemase
VTLLGGTPGSIPAYASLRTMTPDAAAAEAAEHIANGFSAVKIKVGRSDLPADLAAIRAVRAAVGEGARVMVDYNQSLEIADALERVRALDAENVYWIEEPLRADDFEGHARISAAALTPIQLGENWWGPTDMEKSVAAQASDHVMLDVMKLYGVTGWLRAAQIAAGHALPASSHTFPEISAHLLGVTPTAHYLEYLDHAGPILQRPVTVKDGRAYASIEPGTGIAWNEDVIRTQEFI